MRLLKLQIWVSFFIILFLFLEQKNLNTIRYLLIFVTLLAWVKKAVKINKALKLLLNLLGMGLRNKSWLWTMQHKWNSSYWSSFRGCILMLLVKWKTPLQFIQKNSTYISIIWIHDFYSPLRMLIIFLFCFVLFYLFTCLFYLIIFWEKRFYMSLKLKLPSKYAL